MEHRVGKNFFEELPKEPGIYRMLGQKGEVLYVGKAKNLRNRLFTYRRARMGKVSRKTIRMIRMTYDINFELCGTEKEALLLENEMIRRYKPKFNRAKKQPETYYFISLEQSPASLEFSLQMHAPEKEFVFGAFKGHRLVRKAMGGLLRLLYILEHEVESAFQLPPVLSRKLTPMKYMLALSGEESIIDGLFPGILEYLKGKNADLLETLLAEYQNRDLLESFLGKMVLDDLESMKWFYERCAHRNYEVMQQLDLESLLIPQEKLDDYFVEWAFRKG
jgi:excinuclease UvrABC nuclease subunit